MTVRGKDSAATYDEIPDAELESVVGLADLLRRLAAL